MWQNVDRENVQEAQLFEALLAEDANDHSDKTLESVDDKIIELHESAVEEIESKSKMKVTKGVKVALSNHG